MPLALSQIVSAGLVQRADTKLLAPLFACLGRVDDAERLACLDGETRKLRQTEQTQGVLLMDTKEAAALQSSIERMRQVSRVEEIRTMAATFKPIDAPLVRARQVGQAWVFEIEGNGTWTQVDSSDLGRTPEPGDRMRIRRGPIGGFLLNIRTGPAIRVKRTL